MEQGKYYTTLADEEDGYYERKLSLRVGLPPILFLRAVKDFDGKYTSVVRCAQSGHLLASGNTHFENWITALDEAQEKAYAVMHNGA